MGKEASLLPGFIPQFRLSDHSTKGRRGGWGLVDSEENSNPYLIFPGKDFGFLQDRQKERIPNVSHRNCLSHLWPRGHSWETRAYSPRAKVDQGRTSFIASCEWSSKAGSVIHDGRSDQPSPFKEDSAEKTLELVTWFSTELPYTRGASFPVLSY